MTGDLWPSAFVAAVFAIHPLHVESVAWVAERKGLLSGLFFVLTLGAYVGYVRHPFSLARYLVVTVLFALGLMAKPMLVTLPFVLLLLDYWPLGRVAAWDGSCAAAPRVKEQPSPQRGGFPWWLVVEKIPLFALTVASCVATPFTQGNAVTRLDVIGLSSRITNALVSYAAYVGQFFYPVGLAVFYPHPQSSRPIWMVPAALALLVGVSAAAVNWRKRWPCVFVGWFWYLGMLVPMIGLVQVGRHAMADRYAYVTQIGLCLALAWGAAQVAASWPYRRWVYGVASVLVVSLLMGCAWRQTSYWRDSETLWTRTLACTSRNSLAHYNLGMALAGRGRVEEALTHYWKALEIEPNYIEVHNNLGLTLAGRGRVEEALSHYRKALEIKPDYVEAHNNLGLALAGRGQVDEAIVCYRKALEIKPDFAEAHNNLGLALAGRGRVEEALSHYRKALKIKPDYVEAHNNLGNTLAGCGRVDEAAVHYRKALEIRPDNLATINNLAWLLATYPVTSVRDGAKAVELALRATQLCGGQEPTVLDTLAAAYAEAGRFSEAVATANKALDLATRQHNRTLADGLRARLALYKAGKPFHQTFSTLATPPARP